MNRARYETGSFMPDDFYEQPTQATAVHGKIYRCVVPDLTGVFEKVDVPGSSKLGRYDELLGGFYDSDGSQVDQVMSWEEARPEAVELFEWCAAEKALEDLEGRP